MQKIKLELPLDARVLSRAADFLQGCAHDLKVNEPKEPPKPKPTPTPTLDAVLTAAFSKEADELVTIEELERHGHTTPVEGEALDVDSVFAVEDTDEQRLSREEIDEGFEEVTNWKEPGDHDAAGFTWDARIHSTGKNDDGSYKKYGSGKDAGKWIYRRGVTPATVASVEAELKGAPQSSTATPPPPPPIAGATLTPPPPPPPAAQATAYREVRNFPELMAVVQQVKARGVTFEQINAAALQVAGVANIALMASHEPKIPALGQAIQAL